MAKKKEVKAEEPRKNINTLDRLEVEHVLCDSVGPNEYNPNRQADHEFEMLCKSIAEDGFTTPIVVHKQTRKIIDGEHRWTGRIVVEYLREKKVDLCQGKLTQRVKDMIKGARQNRLTIIPKGLTIPAVFADMTYEQMRIATLRHNRAKGSENMDLVANIFKQLEEAGALEHVQESLVMEDEDLKRMLDSGVLELASEDFGEAWVPSTGQEQRAISGESTADGNYSTTASSEAVERSRRKEEQIKAAKTVQEKESLAQDRAVHRMELLLSDEEAAKVRKVFGAKIAEGLMSYVVTEYDRIVAAEKALEDQKAKEKQEQKAARAAKEADIDTKTPPSPKNRGAKRREV